MIGKYFSSCRNGCQTFNAGVADMNLLKAFFLEKCRDNPGRVRDIIDRSNSERGWLILATHDIGPAPTEYGCTPAFFEDVVRYAVGSGARILPVAEALDEIRG